MGMKMPEYKKTGYFKYQGCGHIYLKAHIYERFCDENISIDNQFMLCSKECLKWIVPAVQTACFLC